MRLFFGGDFFPGGEFGPATIDVPEFHRADVRIVNLESPVTSRGAFASKAALYSPEGQLDRMVAAGVTHVCLANNHAHDRSSEGLVSTLENLKSVGIVPFGAGGSSSEARAPVWLSHDLCLIGFCDREPPYLTDVHPATQTSPGVNAFGLPVLIDDLNSLPDGSRAIVMAHWGREHVLLPPTRTLDLATHLAMHPKVQLVVGGHPHIAQGWVSVNGTRAFLSLGNFFFSNFVMIPPQQMVFGGTLPKAKTERYHTVVAPTKKMWPLRNRISLGLVFDSDTARISSFLLKQAPDAPTVQKLRWPWCLFGKIGLTILGACYVSPRCLYKIIEIIDRTRCAIWWYWGIAVFRLRYEGVGPSLRRWGVRT